MKPRRTEKQKELMGYILKAANEGTFLTMSELYDKVSYDCSYGAVRVSVQFLEKQQMIIRRKDGRFTRIVPTSRGYDWFRPGT